MRVGPILKRAGLAAVAGYAAFFIGRMVGSIVDNIVVNGLHEDGSAGVYFSVFQGLLGFAALVIGAWWTARWMRLRRGAVLGPNLFLPEDVLVSLMGLGLLMGAILAFALLVLPAP